MVFSNGRTVLEAHGVEHADHVHLYASQREEAVLVELFDEGLHVASIQEGILGLLCKVANKQEVRNHEYLQATRLFRTVSVHKVLDGASNLTLQDL